MIFDFLKSASIFKKMYHDLKNPTDSSKKCSLDRVKKGDHDRGKFIEIKKAPTKNQNPHLTHHTALFRPNIRDFNLSLTS